MLSGVTGKHAGHGHAAVESHLPTQYRLSETSSFLTGPTAGDPFQVASDYLVSHAAELGLKSSDLASFVVSSQYTDQPSGITHIYLRQTHDGLGIMNADLSINVTARGEIINVSSSFIGDPQVTGDGTPQLLIGASQAFAEFSNDLGLGLLTAPQVISIDSESPDLETVLAASGVALEDVEAKLVYVPTADGLELAWRLNVQTLDQAHWYDAFVDADSGESIYVDDAIGYASYRVFASPLQSPNDGPRTLVTDSHDLIASPFGWHDTNGVAGAEFTDTQGNNAVAQDDVDANDVGGFRPDGGAGLVFDFPHDVEILGDTVDEPQETFQVNLTGVVGGIISDNRGIGTITDDDGTPTLSINDVTVVEGNTGVAVATFTVSLSAVSGQTVTVKYGTANSTALAPADYTATSGTLSFPAGTMTRPISVAVRPDLVDELDETFVVNLLSATNASIADNQAIGTINDDDAPPTMSIKDVVVYEGNSGQTLATFTVWLSAPSGHAISVNYSTADNTALAGVDYAATSGTLILAAGATLKTFTVPFYGDVLDEANESFFVNLSNAIHASLIDNQALATITDNDTAPSLRINDASVVEGNSGATNATFSVTLSTASSQAVSVNFVTANSTALAGSDYTAQSGTLQFAPGEMTKTVAIAVTGDTLDEANETYFVKLSAATSASIADSSGLGTITDNDAAPTLSINDVTIVEGNSGTTTATFTVTLSAASGQTVSVKYATANNTAVASGDYTSTYGALTFAPGVTSKTITVSIKGDLLKKLDEFFFVNLSSPLNATFADSQGRGTIIDDD